MVQPFVFVLLILLAAMMMIGQVEGFGRFLSITKTGANERGDTRRLHTNGIVYNTSSTNTTNTNTMFGGTSSTSSITRVLLNLPARILAISVGVTLILPMMMASDSGTEEAVLAAHCGVCACMLYIFSGIIGSLKVFLVGLACQILMFLPVLPSLKKILLLPLDFLFNALWKANDFFFGRHSYVVVPLLLVVYIFLIEFCGRKSSLQQRQELLQPPSMTDSRGRDFSEGFKTKQARWKMERGRLKHPPVDRGVKEQKHENKR